MPSTHEGQAMTQMLIVEDHSAQPKTTIHILQEEGFETIACQSAAEALASLDHGQIGIAVVNLCLRGLSGAQFLKQLRVEDDNFESLVAPGRDTSLRPKLLLQLEHLLTWNKLVPPMNLWTRFISHGHTVG